jgi:hypothetical protein
MANYMQLAATTQVKVGAGKLFGIFVSASSSGTLTVYDTGAGSTSDPKISNTITVAAGSQYLSFPAGIFFNKGLYIVLGGTSAEFTVVYD